MVTHPKIELFWNSFWLIFKQNVKKVWERRSHAFPPQCNPDLMCCPWHIKLLFMHSVTKKYNYIIIAKMAKFLWPNVLRFCLNFWQIKSLGVRLQTCRLQPKLLHHWKVLFILVPFARTYLCESGFSPLLHLKKSTLSCVLSIGLSITSSNLKN